MDTKKTITVQAVINAGQESVWEFYTNPEHITQWNSASDDWHTPSAENNLQPGGKFNYRMESKDGSLGFDYWGIYDELKPPEFLDFTLGDGRKVIVTFTDMKEKTSAVIEFEPEDTNSMEMQRDGWQAILDNFKKYVEVKKMTVFNPYLNFAGSTEEAFIFYKSVFGGEYVNFTRFEDLPIEGMTLPEEARGKIMHISLPIGSGQMLMGSDALESLGQKLVPGNNLNISIHPDSKEEADQLFNLLSKGGIVEMQMAEQPWGDYYGSFQDKFGVHWMINYHAE